MNVPPENAEYVEQFDLTSLIPIEKLDGLDVDDILDALQNIYGHPILNISVEDLLNDPDILDTVLDYQSDQKVVVFNSEDGTYWSCGNVLSI